ncbi:uncharacterized protein LOC143447045 [Clavelina lepadiformis]|uniref:Sulfotransferase family protein n=1 Tax=Clavelina lepadiformis TaxID=159417 RepID=A0ABP0FHB0_CLALP
MKIIVASYPKTGTKSLNIALSELGYKVYDFVEHFWYHGKYWKRILTTGGSTEDFKKMYEDVDVVMDAPAFRFWEEIHWAFPDAKIILMLRDEDEWYKSTCVQINQIANNTIYKLMLTFSPNGHRYFRHYNRIVPFSFGNEMKFFPWIQITTNELILKQKYRQHNAYVLEHAPADKFLLYDINQGWDPLCTFLGKQIPDKPFPHKNVGGEVVNDWMKEHPVVVRMKREMWVSIGLLLALGSFTCFKMFRSQRWGGLVSFFQSLRY